MMIVEIDSRPLYESWLLMKREENFFNKPVNLYYMLLGSTLALSLLGLIMVFSASSIYSLGSRGTTYGVVIRQFIFLLISLPMAWVLSRLSLRQWKVIANQACSFRYFCS